MPTFQSWPELLTLRPEVIASDGGVGDLQMSLYKAVYHTVDVPYRDVDYYSDITQPTPNVIGFFSRVARRLSGVREPVALFHLDQGMGGGKSHALVGLYHMAANPKKFFATDLGKAVDDEATAIGETTRIPNARIVVLTADHFSPGKRTELFGPAANLFERFVWSLFKGDRKLYDKCIAKGSNKSTLQEALTLVQEPVLILLDELMDYAMELSDAGTVGQMPGEQAFLNALMDACDDVPRVAFVVVMIRSELDPEGYTEKAREFREYIARRLNRNGTTVAVTETGDFAAIIRRRIFEQPQAPFPVDQIVKSYHEVAEADHAWEQQVLDRLGTGKGLSNLQERIANSYPFHPDLMDLVQNEWSKVQGFQRVRSTVAIFALASLHWSQSAKTGGWIPPLIGVGDLPIGGIKGAGTIPQARCLDALLNSGLLLGNDKAIQSYRAVATTDISSADGTGGRAVLIGKRLAEAKLETGQPQAAVRMATALFNYSLVGRAQGRRGATKAELLAALMLPIKGACAFSAADEVFYNLTGDEGLGALEINSVGTSSQRYWLTIKQTLRMFFNSAKGQVTEEDALALVWESAENLATKGQFEEIHHVQEPFESQGPPDVASTVDSQANRLVILHPRRWTLLNGDDGKSRNEIRRVFGVGEGASVVDNAASCVIAIINTYQRRYAVQAAHEVLTWRLVASQVVESEERTDLQSKQFDAESKLKEKVKGAFRHYAYLTRRGQQPEVVFARFDDDKQTALSGNDVWGALINANRAVGEYFDPDAKKRKSKPLSEVFVALLLDAFNRHLTLKEVVSAFYKDPRFPLVPTLDQIRKVIFDLIQPAGHAGPGTGGWELVTSDESRLHVDGPQQLAISSIQQQLRRVASPGAPPNDQTDTGEERTPPRSDDDHVSDSDTTSLDYKDGGPATTEEPPSYSWYRFELINRSITDPAQREAIRRHLLWLGALLDKEQYRHQLLTLKYELLAASMPTLKTDIEARGAALKANKISVEEEP